MLQNHVLYFVFHKYVNIFFRRKYICFLYCVTVAGSVVLLLFSPFYPLDSSTSIRRIFWVASDSVIPCLPSICHQNLPKLM